MYVRSANQGTWTPFNLANQTLYEKKKKDGSHSVLLKTTDSSKLVLDGGFEVNFKVKWNKVHFFTKFYGGYDFNLGLDGTLDFEGSDSYTKKLFPTGNDDWKTLAEFSILGIPVHIDFRLEAVAKVQASATGSFMSEYSNRRSYGFWFSMTNGDWDSGTIHTHDSEWKQPPTWTLEGKATFEAGLKPILALGLGGKYAGVGAQAHAGFTAFPRLKLDAELKANSHAASTLDWQLDACLDLGVHASAKADFWGYEKSKTWEKVLWEGCMKLDDGSKCFPYCEGKNCGPDGCDGVCGSLQGQCEPGWVCNDGVCQCVPDCTNRVCGSDGCGGTCPSGCDQYGEPYECIEGTSKSVCACVPDCSGKECGDNGCGGQCGTCEIGKRCNASHQCEPIPDACVPECGGRQCGRDPVCWLPCPVGNPGSCHEPGDTCSHHGFCCRIAEQFHGTGSPGTYSGALSCSLGSTPGSEAALVTPTSVSDIPSTPFALKLKAGGKDLVTCTEKFRCEAITDLPFRRAETMLWVDEPAAGQAMARAGFGFGPNLDWAVVMDGVAKKAYITHGNHQTDLGAIEVKRWYKILLRTKDDFSQMYFEVPGVGGTWVPAGQAMWEAIRFQTTVTNPPQTWCPLGIGTVGATTAGGLELIPYTAYFDDVHACR